MQLEPRIPLLRSSVHDIADSAVLDEFNLPNKAADRAKEVFRLNAACNLVYPVGANGVCFSPFSNNSVLIFIAFRNPIVPARSIIRPSFRPSTRNSYPAPPTFSRSALESLASLVLKMIPPLSAYPLP